MSGGKISAALSWVLKGWRIWAGLVGLLIMILWTAGTCRPKVAPESIDYEPGRPVPAEAVMLVVSNEPVAVRIDVVGTVASEETIHLSSRIQAYVKEVFISAGGAVKAGQVLITLDDREINEQFAAADAALKQAETEFNRARRLLETKATTEQAFDAAESAFRSAQANVDRVKVMRTYTRITSPIDGVVTDRRIEVGDLAGPGQVLLAVYDQEHMRLEAPVPVRLLDRLPKGREVDVALDRVPDVVRGRVTEIVSEVDPMSRTQKVKIRIDGVGGSLLPGTFGRVWVEEEMHSAILLPAESVSRVGQLEYVQVVENKRVVRRLVKTGQNFAERVEILSGLTPAEMVLRYPDQEP